MKGIRTQNCTHEKIAGCLPYILVLLPVITVITRAACSAMTYDESYTYLCYALALSDHVSPGMLKELYLDSVANNHLLNTALIAAVTRLTGVRFCEFVVRLPVLASGVFYYIFLARCRSKGSVSWIEFTLLAFSYYLNEFFGLARGYGMCAALVFFALIHFRKYLSDNSPGDIWICLFTLICSAYANSVSLLILFSVITVTAVRLAVQKEFFTFLKRSMVQIALCIIPVLLILVYHFRVSDIEKGMPLFRTDRAGFIFYIREYVFLATHDSRFPSALYWMLGIGAGLSAIWMLFKARLKGCGLAVTFLVHILVMLAIVFVFKRGTFLQRLLVPSYPLAVMGGGELVHGMHAQLKARFQLPARCAGIAHAVLLALFLCSFLGHVDLLHTRDWYDDYRIRDLYMNGVERTDPNPCWDFYELQKQFRQKGL